MTFDFDFSALKAVDNETPHQFKEPTERIKEIGHVPIKKRVTKKSLSRYVMHNYKVHVEYLHKIYPIVNFKPIIQSCIVHPTPLNYMATKSKEFNFNEEGLQKRIELIDAFWSRYNFKEVPEIVDITEEGVTLKD